MENYIIKMGKQPTKEIGRVINFVDLGEYLMINQKNLCNLLIITILPSLDKNGFITKDNLKMTQNMGKERLD